MKLAPIDPDSSETGLGEQYQEARPIKSQISFNLRIDLAAAL